MPSCIFLLVRIAAIAVFAFAACLSPAKEASTEVAPTTPLVIKDLGKGTAPLKGPWQFHLGDDLAWANPVFDSSSWEQLSGDRPWGKQGHSNYTGFAWYRCYIELTPALGAPPQFSLLMPKTDDAYEIYWNGSLIGHDGKLSPYPVRYISQPVRSFELGETRGGVLAVRVWNSPLLSDDSSERGGFEEAPLVGSPEAIATMKAARDFQWLSSRQFLLGENLLCALVALLSFLLWWRNPAQRFLFWMAGYALVPPVNLLLLSAHIRWPYLLAMGLSQSISTLQDISLWFLLLWLLPFHENRALVRLTSFLACICVVDGTLDGMLVAMSWKTQWLGAIQAADAFSAFLYILLEAYPLVLASYAFLQRKQLNSTRWLVATSVFLNGMILSVTNAVKQGRQITNWSIASSIDTPLFTVGGSEISAYTLSQALLLAAVVYAVYRIVREDQLRQIQLELEKAELMRESKRMRHHAEHDGLTGLLNHRILVERLCEEMDRSRREETQLSLILIDIDHFKKINDNFGHPAGDLVLKEISAIFAQALRSYDCVGRYGGEEFLLILPGCEIDGALIRAEQLRLAVQSARIQDGDTTMQVTASFGVASDFPRDYEVADVIRTVDAALYQAKRSGRNCVVLDERNMTMYGK